MLSMAQFGGHMAEDRIHRLINEAQPAAPASGRRYRLAAWLAGSLRWTADRIDRPSRTRHLPDPSHGPC
jgi:hypothetical protein